MYKRQIPRIAPGVIVSENEVDSIIVQLKTLAQEFKPKSDNKLEQIISDESELTNAGERVKSAKEKIDHIDDVLARLRG